MDGTMIGEPVVASDPERVWELRTTGLVVREPGYFDDIQDAYPSRLRHVKGITGRGTDRGGAKGAGGQPVW